MARSTGPSARAAAARGDAYAVTVLPGREAPARRRRRARGRTLEQRRRGDPPAAERAAGSELRQRQQRAYVDFGGRLDEADGVAVAANGDILVGGELTTVRNRGSGTQSRRSPACIPTAASTAPSGENGVQRVVQVSATGIFEVAATPDGGVVGVTGIEEHFGDELVEADRGRVGRPQLRQAGPRSVSSTARPTCFFTSRCCPRARSCSPAANVRRR